MENTFANFHKYPTRLTKELSRSLLSVCSMRHTNNFENLKKSSKSGTQCTKRKDKNNLAIIGINILHSCFFYHFLENVARGLENGISDEFSGHSTPSGHKIRLKILSRRPSQGTV